MSASDHMKQILSKQADDPSRHRIAAMIVSRHRAGESVHDLADDYGYAALGVELILAAHDVGVAGIEAWLRDQADVRDREASKRSIIGEQSDLQAQASMLRQVADAIAAGAWT